MRPDTGGTRLFVGVCVAAASVAAASGALGGSGAAGRPTLAVVVVGPGSVRSAPAGIACPGRCVATFAPAASVVLTSRAKSGARFLRWGGDCAGARACRVRVSTLSAVAAQFVGQTTQPRAPAPTSVQSGGYSGRGYGGYSVTFFVPIGARSVVDFSIALGGARVTCAGGGSYDPPFTILKTTIGRDGSFAAKGSESGVVGGASATTTYSLTGRLQGTSATGATTANGVYREDIVFSDTPNRKCTSNDQPWSAVRSLPPPPGAIQPGAYSGRGYGGYGVTFSVPAGAGSVLDFSIALGGARVTCGGGGYYDTPFKILKATVAGDRSFSAKTSQSGVVGGANATITYSVTGYFESLDATGAQTAGGVYREDIVFSDTPNRRCTSNSQHWTAGRSG